MNSYLVKLSAVGLLALACAGGATGSEPPEEDGGSAFGWGRDYLIKVDVNTACLSLGSIISDRSCWYGEVDVTQRLSGFGRIVLGLWTYSDIDGPDSYQRRDLFNERDPYLFYGYDFMITEGWHLNQQIGYIYVTLDGYRGASKSCNDETYAEWTYVGELVTPFLTPTLEVRVV